MSFLLRTCAGFIYSLFAASVYASTAPNTQIINNENHSRETHNQQTAQPAKTLTIGVLGDSLSAAYGLKTTQGWVYLMEQKLAQAGIAARIVNASVSGATTDAGLNMQQGLLNQKPDILILELGANDGLQGKPLGLIANNLSQLITRSQAAGAEVLLLGIHLPPNMGKRYTLPFFEQYSTLAKRHNTALVPFFLDRVAQDPALMQSDGLHPNAKAQPVILDNIWPTLLALINNLQQK